MTFINRVRELDFLRSAGADDRSQLIVVYGKRRVGKTALVREFSKELVRTADKRSELSLANRGRAIAPSGFAPLMHRGDS